MKRLLFLVIALAFVSSSTSAREKIPATLYKNPGCMCCDNYANYLRANGFNVSVVEPSNMTAIKQKYGVRKDLESCHTAIIGKYAIEGHMPVAAINRLLAEKPDIKGISLPGMTAGSPGMSGTKQGPFEILSITGRDGAEPVFAKE